jgi:hypothetical protein
MLPKISHISLLSCLRNFKMRLCTLGYQELSFVLSYSRLTLAWLLTSATILLALRRASLRLSYKLLCFPLALLISILKALATLFSFLSFLTLHSLLPPTFLIFYHNIIPIYFSVLLHFKTYSLLIHPHQRGLLSCLTCFESHPLHCHRSVLATQIHLLSPTLQLLHLPSSLSFSTPS